MSHTATVKVEFKDLTALKTVCDRLKIKLKIGEQTVKLYSETKAGDISFQLPGWNYPVIISEGTAYYDNFNNQWGHISELHKLQQAYAEEATMNQAHLMGYSVERQLADDGSIQLYLTR